MSVFTTLISSLMGAYVHPYPFRFSVLIFDKERCNFVENFSFYSFLFLFFKESNNETSDTQGELWPSLTH